MPNFSASLISVRVLVEALRSCVLADCRVLVDANVLLTGIIEGSNVF